MASRSQDARRFRARRLALWLFAALLALAGGLVGMARLVAQGPRIGAAVPEVVFVALDGQPIPLAKLAGRPDSPRRPVVLRFSSRSCSFCSDDLGRLEAIQQEFGEALRVVAVEVGDPPDLVRASLGRRSLSFDVLVDPEGRALDRLRARGLPMWYFIDAGGRLVGSVWGEAREQGAAIRHYLSRLVVAGPDPTPR